jgi:hypothetical protein
MVINCARLTVACIETISRLTEAFTAAVVQAASIPGQMALIGRVLVGGGWPTVLCIAAIVIVAGLGIGLKDADPTSLAVWFQRLAPLGGAVAALGALWQAFRSAEPILKGGWKYAKAVESAREKLTPKGGPPALPGWQQKFDVYGGRLPEEFATASQKAPRGNFLMSEQRRSAQKGRERDIQDAPSLSADPADR